MSKLHSIEIGLMASQSIGRFSITSYYKFYNGGSSDNSSQSNPQATPQQMLALYNQYLPQSLATTVGQAVPTANTLAGAAASANPIYTASGLQQLSSYAPGYAQVGNNLSQQQAGNTANLLSGQGGVAAAEATGLSNVLNPLQTTNQLQGANLLNSINLNGLTGPQTAQVERSLNQSNYATGNLGLDNATNAVSNAMQFGNALQNKQSQLSSALGTTSNIAANQNSFTNPVSTALNSGNTSGNFGLSTFAPTQANSNLTAPLSFGSALGNQIAGVSSAANSSGSGGSIQGGICYITTIVCEHKGLADDCEMLTILRKFRDECVPKNIIDEYYKLAPIILPKIKNSWRLRNKISSILDQCVEDIKHNKRANALNMYYGMTLMLKNL